MREDASNYFYMGMARTKLLLLPGLDGSGELFRDFLASLPAEFDTEAVRYPADRVAGYEELEELVVAAMPKGEPFVMVAESYSTPLAIRIAAMRPEGLQGLVLCAGFATSPVKGWMHDVTKWLPLRTMERMPAKFVAKWFLLGADAPDRLVTTVAAEIDWVSPEVLAARVREVLMCDVRAELARVETPIQYLRAGKDRLVSLECLEEILLIQPSTEVMTIDGPHLLMQREPQLCATVVAKFAMGLEMAGVA